MKRLFLAIPLGKQMPFIDLSNTLQKQLHFERINWVNQQNPHLTLKFIGYTHSDDISKIIEKMNEIIPQYSRFELRFDKTGIFGSRYAPRVLWLGMNEIPETLLRLSDAVLDAFDAIGFAHDSQNFVPHLTICRIKNLVDKVHFRKVVEAIEQKIYVQESVTKITLFESILRSEGAIHKAIRSFDLKNSY
ncbi:MAG: RNA 2',3'-cyclic phosphodiesterase [Lentimicrobiaceae bacterium]|jgi:2'-5' RNA ligase|nr:RNA 2',3'-cyclic phosphodiesterase [Lentimicrobiaceae bacterium]